MESELVAGIADPGPVMDDYLACMPLGRVGAPADVTLVDPSAEWTVDPARFQSKSRNTPFEGRPVIGRVIRTWVGGKSVWPLEEKR